MKIFKTDAYRFEIAVILVKLGFSTRLAMLLVGGRQACKKSITTSSL